MLISWDGMGWGGRERVTYPILRGQGSSVDLVAPARPIILAQHVYTYHEERNNDLWASICGIYVYGGGGGGGTEHRKSDLT